MLSNLQNCAFATNSAGSPLSDSRSFVKYPFKGTSESVLKFPLIISIASFLENTIPLFLSCLTMRILSENSSQTSLESSLLASSINAFVEISMINPVKIIKKILKK